MFKLKTMLLPLTLLLTQIQLQAADEQKNIRCFSGDAADVASQIKTLTRHDLSRNTLSMLEEYFKKEEKYAKQNIERYQQKMREETARLEASEKALKLLLKWDDEKYYGPSGLRWDGPDPHD